MLLRQLTQAQKNLYHDLDLYSDDKYQGTFNYESDLTGVRVDSGKIT